MKINKNSLRAAAISLTAAQLLSACANEPASKTDHQAAVTSSAKQNVVMIIVDDLRPVLGVYGDQKAYTPNMDALAAEGVTFTQAFTNVPVCGASRASMMTGLRPTADRFIDYKTKAEVDAPDATSLPQVLRESGYATQAIGKIFHHSSDMKEQSWSEGLESAGLSHVTMLNPESKKYQKPSKKNPTKSKGPWYEIADVSDESYPDGKVKQKALKALSTLAEKDEPFFLSVGFIRPHLPFYAPKKYYDLHDGKDFEPFFDRGLPEAAPSSLKGSGEIHSYHFRDTTYNSDEFHTASLKGYYASVSYVDALVGDIVDQIDALGLRDNTTIMLLSDHGFHLGEHNFWTKHTLLDTSLRIPLIVSSPNAKRGVETDALVELVDIFPTVLDITQNTTAADIAGESFSNVLQKTTSHHKDYIYSRFKIGDSIITGQYIFTSYKAKSGKVEEMLFDLEKDPHETKNVVADKAYSSVVAELRPLLADCMKNNNCRTK